MTMNFLLRLMVVVLLAAALIGCASQADGESVSSNPPASAEQIAEAIKKSEELFKQRADIAKMREAVQVLAAVRNPDQRNFEVEWKFARFCYFFGRQTTDTNERDRVFLDGEQAGRIASRVATDKPDGYFWFAANLGERSKVAPVTVGVKAVGDIKEAMNKVIELDPKYQNGSAYDALAQIELQTAGILDGDPKKAVELLETATKFEKNNTYLLLHLAEAYLATGRKPEAKKQLETLLKMEPNPEFLPEYKETTEKAKKLLETKF
jgi:tetratricopeptide (TPR) repeat protein